MKIGKEKGENRQLPYQRERNTHAKIIEPPPETVKAQVGEKRVRRRLYRWQETQSWTLGQPRGKTSLRQV